MELINLIIHVLSNTQLGVISSILTMPILIYIIKEQKKSEVEARKRNGGIMSLLQCKLTEIHEEALECRNDTELLPEQQIENFFECYKQYKELGGNGYADRMKSDIDDIRASKIMRGR